MYLVQEKTGGDVLSERHVCSASFREIDTHSPFYENLYGLASRSMVEHMIQVQPIRAFHLLNNRDWFRGVHMTQAWPMKTLQTLTTKTGSGDANPPWNFLEPSESLCSHFSRIPHLKIWNNLWALMVIFAKIWTSPPEYDTNIARTTAKRKRKRESSSHDLNSWIQIPSYLSQ